MNIAVLASGAGTTFDNLCYHCEEGILKGKAEIVCLLTDRINIGALDIASKRGIIAFTLSKNHLTLEQWSLKLLNEALWPPKADLYVMAGFMSRLIIPEDFSRPILNIHPSLLPKFGGKGMYDLNVHKAVLAAKETSTGCTVHLVNNEYDSGEILAQKSIDITGEETPEQLKCLTQALEREVYPQAILDFYESIMDK